LLVTCVNDIRADHNGPISFSLKAILMSLDKNKPIDRRRCSRPDRGARHQQASARDHA
jgi:hypothetical protein